MSKVGKPIKRKNYGKRLETANKTIDFLNSVSNLMILPTLIASIIFAPLGFLGVFFSIFFVSNMITFLYTSAPWKGEFDKASKEIVDLEKEQNKEIKSLKEKENVVIQENQAVQKEFKNNKNRVKELEQKVNSNNLSLKDLQKTYNDLVVLINDFIAFNKKNRKVNNSKVNNNTNTNNSVFNP